MTLGKFSRAFVTSGGSLSWSDFAGVAFVIVFLALIWGRFVNELV